jgi:hypothetical protein
MDASIKGDELLLLAAVAQQVARLVVFRALLLRVKTQHRLQLPHLPPVVQLL